MPALTHRSRKRVASVAAFCLALSATIFGQGTQDKRPPEQDDVVRVYTDLVQTDVMVFDKEGKFVTGLKREDFALKIDGKVRPIEFFDRITAGSANEEVQLAVARGASSPSAPKTNGPTPRPLDRGRIVFFYFDDFHLGLGSLVPAKKVLLHFVDKEMGQNDQAAVTSASGQIGFLQQLTDNKNVLRAAAERLRSHPQFVRDMQRPNMSEYQALQIDHDDLDALGYFIDEYIKDNPGTTRELAGDAVHQRASQLLQQAAYITTNTLSSLEHLVHSCVDLPGRKLLFFFSDGFFLDNRNSDSMDRLRRITSAAARSAVVIYSLDARGLVASLADASEPGAFDLSGRLQRASSGELFASQDAMNALAKDTGGQPVFNSNALGVGLTKALKETSTYYLLSWRPASNAQATARFRHVEVSLVGHPDLTVRVRRGFFDLDPAPTQKQAKEKEPAKAEKPPAGKLWEALNARYPGSGLPVSLNLTFLHTPDKGPQLTVSMQITSEFLLFSPLEGKQRAVVDIAGSVYNDQGKPEGSFSERLTINSSSPDQAHPATHEVIYSYPIYLKPGLYQVRVGARDQKTGKTGTVHQWIEIPDLASHQLMLSSLIVGERRAETINSAATSGQSPLDQVQLRVDHHFHLNSFLRFIVFVYNPMHAQTDTRLDVALQVQVLRDDQPVITTALRKISTEGVQDLDRLPYAADVSLAGLGAGRYVFQVTAIDRVSKTSTSQRMRFEIE
jgi:VWFA-related protein